jgi:hypothetical protein
MNKEIRFQEFIEKCSNNEITLKINREEKNILEEYLNQWNQPDDVVAENMAKDEWFFNYVLFPSYVDIFDKKGNKYAPVLNMYVKKVVFPK